MRLLHFWNILSVLEVLTLATPKCFHQQVRPKGVHTNPIILFTMYNILFHIQCLSTITLCTWDGEDEEDIDFCEEQQLPVDVAGTLEVNMPNGDEQTSSERDIRRRWRGTCHLKLSKTDEELDCLADEYPFLAGKLCFDYLRLFIDDEILDLIVEESQRYASEIKNIHDFHTDRSEIVFYWNTSLFWICPPASWKPLLEYFRWFSFQHDSPVHESWSLSKA